VRLICASYAFESELYYRTLLCKSTCHPLMATDELVRGRKALPCVDSCRRRAATNDDTTQRRLSASDSDTAITIASQFDGRHTTQQTSLLGESFVLFHHSCRRRKSEKETEMNLATSVSDSGVAADYVNHGQDDGKRITTSCLHTGRENKSFHAFMWWDIIATPSW